MSKTVKIVCAMCNGQKYVEDTEYETGKKVKFVCPSCTGLGYNTFDK